MSVDRSLPTVGFFNEAHAGSAKAHKTSPNYVDVGGKGDCGFRSLAAGIIDSYLNKERTAPNILATILREYFKYAPQHQVNFSEHTPIKGLLEKISLAELMDGMAYTLRQLAVDEMCAHPAVYRGPFVEKHENTTPASMRRPSVYIDETAIAALSNKLNLPIHLEVGGELPLHLHYNEEKISPQNAEIRIKLENEHYVPYLKNPEPFHQMNRHAVRPLQVNPVKQSSKVDENQELALILEKIKQTDEALLAAFNENHMRLTTLMISGELDTDALLAIYLDGMNSSDYLQGYGYAQFKESGEDNFLTTIEQAKKGVHEVHLNSIEEKITESLVHAISRAITIGHLDGEKVWNHARSCRV